MKKRVFVSKKAQRHSSKGDFYYHGRNSNRKTLTMKSGGHGQENISYLTKHKMNHDIETTFSNGVRLGHIEKHRNKRDRQKNGHAWFPKSWNITDITNAGKHVASLKKNRHLTDGQKYTGRYKGVTVGIIARRNRIKTIFPFFDVNKHARRKAHIIKKK